MLEFNKMKQIETLLEDGLRKQEGMDSFQFKVFFALYLIQMAIA